MKYVKRRMGVKDVGEHTFPKRPDFMIALGYGKNLTRDLFGHPVPGWKIELWVKGKLVVCRIFTILPHALERLGGMLDVIQASHNAALSLTFPSQEDMRVWLALFHSGLVWRGYTRDSTEESQKPKRTSRILDTRRRNRYHAKLWFDRR